MCYNIYVVIHISLNVKGAKNKWDIDKSELKKTARKNI